MDLREYLFYNRMHKKDLAEIVGCNPKYLCNIINGIYKPSPALAQRIKEATGVEMEPSSASLHKRLRRTRKEAA